MTDKAFKIGLLVVMVALAIALFQHSENGRYHYFNDGNHQGIVLDSRTGEFWTERGDHFEPRVGRIIAHHPWIEDATADDDRSKALSDCLWDHAKTPRLCVAESRAAQITAYHRYAYPSVQQAAADDARADNFQSCLATHEKAPERCVALITKERPKTPEENLDFQPETQGPPVPPASSQ